VPKLWNQTIETHRREVRETILQTTAALVAEHGLRAVTMSQVAAEAGIGRATLYKYFADIEEILLAWHERRIGDHLAQLAEVRDRTAGGAGRKLAAVLEAYVAISRERHDRHDSEVAAFLHRDAHLADAQRRLHGLIRDLIAGGAAEGDLRDDVGADELAAFCVHALAAARSMSSKAAAGRLVSVTVDGLRARPA
jgi:AcrR family transcriptional regulator